MDVLDTLYRMGGVESVRAFPSLKPSATACLQSRYESDPARVHFCCDSVWQLIRRPRRLG
eukprot:910596-Rhodomonas_salina.1